MKNRVLVLGSTGLVGHQVYNYLKDNSDYHLLNISYRKKLQDDTILLDVKDENNFINQVKILSPNHIINCIGILISGAKSEVNFSSKFYSNHLMLITNSKSLYLRKTNFRLLS